MFLHNSMSWLPCLKKYSSRYRNLYQTLLAVKTSLQIYFRFSTAPTVVEIRANFKTWNLHPLLAGRSGAQIDSSRNAQPSCRSCKFRRNRMKQGVGLPGWSLRKSSSAREKGAPAPAADGRLNRFADVLLKTILFSSRRVYKKKTDLIRVFALWARKCCKQLL